MESQPLNKKSFTIIIPFLMDKIQEVAFVETTNTIIQNLIVYISPKFIAQEMIAQAPDTKKSPKVHQELCK